MFKKLMKKSGLKASIKRKFPRGSLAVKLCATILVNYKKGDKTFTYGDCFSIRTYDISSGGLCISHPDRLLAGKVLMINSKNNLKKVKCMDCAMLGVINDEFVNKPLLGKVVWATEKRAGIEFFDINDGDKRKLDKLAKTSF